MLASTWGVSVPAKMDKRRVIIDFFQKQGILIQPEAVDFLVKKEDGIEACKRVLREMAEKPFIISLNDLQRIIEEKRVVEKKEVKVEVKIEKKRGREGFRILKDVTGKSTCEGKVNDFVSLFRDRYEKMEELLRKRQEMRNAMPIKKAFRASDEISIIGIVRDVRRVRNGSIVELEDYEDVIPVYVPIDVDVSVVNDEVIGVVGKKAGDLFIAKSVVRPEIPVSRNRNFSHEEKYVAFLSDIHVGSKSFLEKEWSKLVEWLNGKNGNERQRDVANKIEYIIISGDLVEGVGIYPGQQNDLVTDDIYKQYGELAEKLKDFPSDIKLIIQPGNHDAVRPPLPQPAFEKEIREIFSDLNAIFIGNPCYFEIDGVVFLSYHGQSIQDFASSIPGMNQNNPTKIMKEMLRRRHLAPIYGSISSLAPEKEDYMIIDTIPDIFVTGHVHVTSVELYRDVLLLNASAWQRQTEYQKMMNLLPDPAKTIVVNLQNLVASVMQFS